MGLWACHRRIIEDAPQAPEPLKANKRFAESVESLEDRLFAQVEMVEPKKLQRIPPPLRS